MCFCLQIIQYLHKNHFLLISTLFSLIICNSLQSLAYPEHSHEKCISKSDTNDIRLSCGSNERIAIFEAFFTTSYRHRCSNSQSPVTQLSNELTDDDRDVFYRFPAPHEPCTDDLRLSLNKKCSGVGNCKFSLNSDHIPKCIGEDGSAIIKYTCFPENRYQPFCNLNLSSNYGYVSTPGYPMFYPPYEKCVWNIEGGVGQVIQIDLLDVAIKEPFIKNNINPKKPKYQCSDRLILIEGNTKLLTVCGEVNTNLVQFRSKSNALTVDFLAEDFSPTRGLLFRYSLQNCPTIPAPKNGHLIARNGSFAYYSCCLDYVFDDTKEVERVLYCEYGNHWNSSVSKCVSIKELSITSSLTLSSESKVLAESTENVEHSYLSDILIPVLLMIALLVANAVIVWVLFKLKRKQNEDKNTESAVPLNNSTVRQTNV